MAGRPPSPSFPFFPFYYIPLFLNHHTLVTNWRAFGHMGWLSGHLHWPFSHTLAPYKRDAKGSLIRHPISSKA
jgi:hypothetical protein